MGGISRLPRLLIVLAFAALAAPGAGARADLPVLNAIVGTNDAYVITLNDASGKKVSQISPGTYSVVVDDRSAIHNFHLASNDDLSVDFRTDVDFVGQKTFTVTFKDQTRYAYACEPHWQVMNGSFFVTPTAPPPTPARPLRATVTAGGKVRLSSASVRPGRYRITVRDSSARDNFHLRGAGVNKRTSLRGRGTSTWTVKLKSGRYSYGSDRTGLKRRLTVG
jgi:plastocyanin